MQAAWGRGVRVVRWGSSLGSPGTDRLRGSAQEPGLLIPATLNWLPPRRLRLLSVAVLRGWGEPWPGFSGQALGGQASHMLWSHSRWKSQAQECITLLNHFLSNCFRTLFGLTNVSGYWRMGHVACWWGTTVVHRVKSSICKKQQMALPPGFSALPPPLPSFLSFPFCSSLPPSVPPFIHSFLFHVIFNLEEILSDPIETTAITFPPGHSRSSHFLKLTNASSCHILEYSYHTAYIYCLHFLGEHRGPWRTQNWMFNLCPN